jgi:hypothetical protein
MKMSSAKSFKNVGRWLVTLALLDSTFAFFISFPNNNNHPCYMESSWQLHVDIIGLNADGYFLLPAEVNAPLQQPTEPISTPRPIETSTSLSSSSVSFGGELVGGLNDDGDFLMVGINDDAANLQYWSDTTTEEKNLSITAASVSRTSSASSLGLESNSDSHISSSTTTTALDPLRTLSSSTRDDVDDDDDVDSALLPPILATITRLHTWLLEIIPTLSPADIQVYAAKLDDIGFDPECKTQCELLYDDLDFMKLLHRRYLFKEVSGQDHPWEA